MVSTWTRFSLVCLALGLLFSASAIGGCNRSPATSVPTKVTSSDSLDTVGAVDAVVVGDSQTDVETGKEDAEIQDDAADGDNDVQGDAPQALDPLCNAKLPEPGEKCTKLGAVSCSNVGATKSTTLFKFCIRPNYLHCVKSTGGELVWELATCKASLEATDPACTNYESCMIWGDMHRCQPTRFDGKADAALNGVKAAATTLFVCQNSEEEVQCGGNQIDRCTSLLALDDAAAAIKAQYDSKCAKFLDLGSYLFRVEACDTSPLDCPCKNPKPPPGPQCEQSVFIPMCFTHPDSGKPACQKTCKDVGAPGY